MAGAEVVLDELEELDALSEEDDDEEDDDSVPADLPFELDAVLELLPDSRLSVR